MLNQFKARHQSHIVIRYQNVEAVRCKLAVVLHGACDEVDPPVYIRLASAFLLQNLVAEARSALAA